MLPTLCRPLDCGLDAVLATTPPSSAKRIASTGGGAMASALPMSISTLFGTSP